MLTKSLKLFFITKMLVRCLDQSDQYIQYLRNHFLNLCYMIIS